MSLFQVGVLDRLYTYNMFEKTDLVSGFKMEHIPKDEVGLREAIRLLSVAHGQGVLKCNCKTGNCKSGKCSCFNHKQKCNSRCHGGNLNENCVNCL